MKDNCIVLRPYCLLTKNENKKEKEFEANVVSGIRLIVNGKKRYQLLNVGRGNLKVKQIYTYMSPSGGGEEEHLALNAFVYRRASYCSSESFL